MIEDHQEMGYQKFNQNQTFHTFNINININIKNINLMYIIKTCCTYVKILK